MQLCLGFVFLLFLASGANSQATPMVSQAFVNFNFSTDFIGSPDQYVPTGLPTCCPAVWTSLFDRHVGVEEYFEYFPQFLQGKTTKTSGGPMTFEAVVWIDNSTQSGSEQLVVDWGSGVSCMDNIQLYIRDIYYVGFRVFHNTAKNMTSPPAVACAANTVMPQGAGLPSNTWVNIVVTIASDATWMVYLNGVVPDGFNAYQLEIPLRLLRPRIVLGTNFKGALDSFRAWNRTLNAAEVLALYNEQLPIDCTFGPWSNFSDCSAPCGGGLTNRTRTILTPALRGGDCVNFEQHSCHTQLCDCNVTACAAYVPFTCTCMTCVSSDWVISAGICVPALCTIAGDCSSVGVLVSGYRPDCVCNCPPLYHGLHCETASPCSTDPSAAVTTGLLALTGDPLLCNATAFALGQGFSVPNGTQCGVTCQVGYITSSAQWHCIAGAWTMPQGFVGCTDINECMTDNGGCEANGDVNAVCTNRPGTFACSCSPFIFQLAVDGLQQSCNDVNECETNNGNCGFGGDGGSVCVNTVGSWHCLCSHGFSGNGTQICLDINECQTNVGGCQSNGDTSASCANTLGAYTCGCTANYQLISATTTTNELVNVTCEYAASAQSTNEAATIGGASGGVIFVMVVVLICCVWRVRVQAARSRKADAELADLKTVVSFADLQLHNVLGEGMAGTVYAAIWHGTDVAVKVMKDQAATAHNLEVFRSEVNIHKQLPFHPRIINFVGSCNVSPSLAIVMKRMDCGSAEDLFIVNQKFLIHNGLADDELAKNLKTVTQVALDASAGLLHCHLNHLIHRDVRAANVLVTLDNSQHRATVADFGLSRFLAADATFGIGVPNEKLPIMWMSPENIIRRHYSTPSDVYMFGMFLFELVSRSRPFSSIGISDFVKLDENQLMTFRPSLPANCPEPLGAIIVACWHPQPEQRPALSDVNLRLQAFLEQLYVIPANQLASVMRIGALPERKGHTNEPQYYSDSAYQVPKRGEGQAYDVVIPSVVIYDTYSTRDPTASISTNHSADSQTKPGVNGYGKYMPLHEPTPTPPSPRPLPVLI